MRLTRWMLQVGASITETARSFASWARIFKPACSTSEVSHVAPKAVADCQWLRIRGAGDFEWCFANWQTLRRCRHKNGFSSYTIRTIANLEVRVTYQLCKILRTNTLTDGIRRRSTERVYHIRTPEVRRITSSIFNLFKTLSMSAVAKSEGDICTALEQWSTEYYVLGIWMWCGGESGDVLCLILRPLNLWYFGYRDRY